MTFEDLAKVVADGFKEVMKEEGFDTFDEMRACYWWDSNDIKDEVEAYIKEADENSDVVICLSDDRTDVYIGDDYISYKSFSNMWHRLIKKG